MFKSLFTACVWVFFTFASVNASAAPTDGAESLPPAVTSMSESTATVNLNSATAETLQKELSGVGANKAAAIVAYRDESGPFTSVDELIEVKGIGKALLDKNRHKLTVE